VVRRQLFVVGAFAMANTMSVIFINGCTSSGKTSIARKLQERLSGFWLTSGIDHAIAMAPLSMHHHPDGFSFDTDDRGEVRLNFGPLGWGLLLAHQRAAAAMSGGGAGVILDEVMVVPGLLDSWLTALAGHDVWMIGLHCDLPELERREIARGDRRIGQARGQFDLVHHGMRYDLELDTTNRSADDLASAIAHFIEASLGPVAFSVMTEMRAGKMH
jgi:chloramphenicol 3-O phosphotransferase